MIDRSGILQKSPLVFAIASIRFTPWLLMAQKIAEIHDELREEVPIIHRIQVQQVEGGPRPNIPAETVTTSSAWMLLSSDRSLCIHFAVDQLLVLSKKYIRYSDFEAILSKSLGVLFGRMRSIMDVTSLGVRYVDHIRLSESETAKDYVTPHLLPAEFSGLQVVGGVFVGTYKADDAELRVRCITQPDALAVPEDIVPLLAMSQEPGVPLNVETLKNSVLLDIDAVKGHPTPERMVNSDAVLKQLGTLHEKANAFFRHESVCTENAFRVWKGEV